MMVLIRFWRSLIKKTAFRLLEMKYNIFFIFTLVLGRFFPARIRIFDRSGSGLRKKNLIWIGIRGK